MYDMFEVPAHYQIHVGNGSYSNVGCVVARSRSYYARVQVSVSEAIRPSRRAHDLHLLGRQVRQYGAHQIWGQRKFIEGDVGNDSAMNSVSKQPPNTDVSA